MRIGTGDWSQRFEDRQNDTTRLVNISNTFNNYYPLLAPTIITLNYNIPQSLLFQGVTAVYLDMNTLQAHAF